jgi:LasA protease
MKHRQRSHLAFLKRCWLSILCVAAFACQALPEGALPGAAQSNSGEAAQTILSPTQDPLAPTPFATRPVYAPGEMVDYTAQTGDTMTVLARRFNTTEAEILEANPFIPAGATTMPPGMPMKIPVYYLPLWGPSNQILPDSQFINGPAVVGFDTAEFVSRFPGWLKYYREYAADAQRSGADIIDLVARNYSVSPRLLLALLEYQAGALTQPVLADSLATYPLGYESYDHKGLYLQLNWAANFLNNGYYAYRQGKLGEILLQNDRTERLDPWLNTASAALHHYFNYQFKDDALYYKAIAHDGLAQTFRDLFGDPWANDQPHIPGSLSQPEFILPIEFGETWAFTGGPHTGWGLGEPLAALDFAPPVLSGSCDTAPSWALAIASGVIVRSETGQVMIDTDGDSDERTGWNIFYLHIATEDRIPIGATVERGDRIGHPSCEGGRSTGSHIHLARKYNGEWIPAEGVLAFNLEGWIAFNGSEEYRGTLKRGNRTIVANVNSKSTSFIQSERR